MLFAIQPAAMNGTDPVLSLLDAIVARSADEVHKTEIIHADQLENSRWYSTSRADRRKLLEEIATTSIYPSLRTRGPHLRQVEVSDEASAARARNIAYTPLTVLAENDVSDGALVEAALRVFGAQATIELCFGAPSKIDPPAFQIESRGGHGELPKLIATRVAEATARKRPARLVVVTDSDGEWPGDVKDHAVNIRGLCAAEKIPCPPLNKRTAENYIPDAVWSEWVADRSRTNMKPVVEALLRLSSKQRDHIDMGSPAASLASTGQDVVVLFQSVSVADRTVFRGVNLKGKKDAMMILVLKNQAATLTPADLEARDHQGDLLALVHHIENEL